MATVTAPVVVPPAKAKKVRKPLTKAGALKRIMAILEGLSKDTSAQEAGNVAAAVAAMYTTAPTTPATK